VTKTDEQVQYNHGKDVKLAALAPTPEHMSLSVNSLSCLHYRLAQHAAHKLDLGISRLSQAAVSETKTY
jgi:hypothetical protein